MTDFSSITAENAKNKFNKIEKLLDELPDKEISEKLKDEFTGLKNIFFSKEHEIYRKILNTTSDAIWVIDKDHTVLYANALTKKLFGFSPNYIIGKKCWGPVHNTKEAIKNCPLTKAMQSLKREKVELKMGGRWFEVVVDPIIDEKGEFESGIHIIRDITDHKRLYFEVNRSKHKIEKMNKLFRTMADTMPDMLWAKDINNRYIFVNRAMAEILLNAKDVNEPIGKTDMYFAERERKAHPENPEWHTFGEMCRDSDTETIKAGKPMQFDEYGNVKGKFLFLDVHKAPMYNDNGEIIGVVGSGRDVTQQKLFEKILRESEIKYRELFENAPVGYLILDENGVILDANETALKRFGYSKEEFLQRNIKEFVPPEEIKTVERNIDIILKEGELQTEAVSISKTGKKLNLLLREKRIKLGENKYGILTASIDISKEKEFYQKLIEREKQLTTLIDSTPTDLVYFKDENERWILANKLFLHMFDLNGTDYLGKKDEELISLVQPDLRENFKNLLKNDNLILRGKKFVREIYSFKKDSGNNLEFDVIKTPLFDENGKRMGLVTVARNITKLQKAKKLLIESEAKFRTVWENSISPMRLQDENSVVVNVNQAFCKLLGLPKKQIIGKKITDLIKVEKRISKNYKENFKNRTIPKHRELQVVLPNGESKYLELTNSFITFKENKQTLLLTSYRDITEQKRLIAELTEARDKAEEINKLKTQFFMYMGHELRTPFMGIIGYAQILEHELENEEHKKMARYILATSSRMIETLSNILDLTKIEFDKEEITIDKINVNEIVREIHTEFQQSAKQKGLDFKIELPTEEIIIESDEKMIFSIINNLVSNAIKFTEKGFVKIELKKSENKIILGVSDSGIGIPKEKQDIVWDEFRQVSEGTTRKFQGSGLGLTIVKKYTEILGGEINMVSEVNVGTTFTIKLPMKFINNNI